MARPLGNGLGGPWWGLKGRGSHFASGLLWPFTRRRTEDETASIASADAPLATLVVSIHEARGLRDVGFLAKMDCVAVVYVYDESAVVAQGRSPVVKAAGADPVFDAWFEFQVSSHARLSLVVQLRCPNLILDDTLVGIARCRDFLHEKINERHLLPVDPNGTLSVTLSLTLGATTMASPS
mmetsp:Transcript_24460/g.78997  ORF Transcript_24460/g.78997 Transcript_24460/m.78997 type:complete len:181 (-) Transcript_24460:1498-2040(-)